MSDWQESFAPDGYRSVQPWIISENTSDLIVFLGEVFGAVERPETQVLDDDGRIIHVEVVIGDSVIMLFDSKPDWPHTPAFLQTYVADIGATLDRATAAGAVIVTEPTDVVPGEVVARFRDRWGNLWWLFQHTTSDDDAESIAINEDPDHLYDTLIEAMRPAEWSIDGS